MGDVTSHPLANQAKACLFGRSLNTSLCEIYDRNAAFLLIKTVLHKNFNLYTWKKRTDIVDLSYNIEECLAVNDYYTDWLEFEVINSLRPLLLHINKSRRKYLFEADDNQTFDSIHYSPFVLILETDDPLPKKQTFLISNKVKPQNSSMFINTSN